MDLFQDFAATPILNGSGPHPGLESTGSLGLAAKEIDSRLAVY